nr:GNAT family N-acetyltransferase [Bacteroidota bacterium]
MNKDKVFKIRNLKASELKLALDWAAEEGWNPGLYDAEPFDKADPNGYFVGELDGEAICICSAVAYNDGFGFIGFYIVKPEFREQIYGAQIALHGLKYLGNRNIGIDGVFDKQEAYARLGFKFAYRNIRFETKAFVQDYSKKISIIEKATDELIAFDGLHFPASRTAFISSWIDQPLTKCFTFSNNNKLQGFGCIRKCRVGYKIGPLFAVDQNIAGELLKAMLCEAGDELVYFDVPECNAGAMELASQYNMKMVFGTARMYSKEFPDLPLHQIFGITSFELG